LNYETTTLSRVFISSGHKYPHPGAVFQHLYFDFHLMKEQIHLKMYPEERFPAKKLNP